MLGGLKHLVGYVFKQFFIWWKIASLKIASVIYEDLWVSYLITNLRERIGYGLARNEERGLLLVNKGITPVIGTLDDFEVLNKTAID